MKKKMISIVLVFALLAAGVVTNSSMGNAATALDVGSSSSSVYGAVSEIKGINFDAENIKYSGDIAEIKWGIDGNGVFAFYHSDKTPERRIHTVAGFTPYSAAKDVPWYPYRSEIKYITLANLDSFISIGSMDYYFYGCQNLLGVVMLPAVASSMNYTFYNDVSLQSFGCTMPVTQRMNSCFQGCQSLDADIVFTRQPDECSNAFLYSPARVIVPAGIYHPDSKLANTSKCREYHAAHKQELTLLGISRSSGKLVNECQSDSYITTIRYGQKISDVSYGSTGGLRFAYAYGNSDFLHSVYVAADIDRVMKRNMSENQILDAGVYEDFMDVNLRPIPSSLSSNIICPADFYRDSYKSLIVERCPVEVCKMSLSEHSFVYDGTAKMPAVTLMNPYSGETLTKGTDYTVSYENAVNAGTAQITVTGTGNYTGTVSETFTIAKADLSGGVRVNGYSGNYDGNEHRISVQVQKPSSGYTVMYGTSPGNCTLSASPAFRDAGDYTVYFQVSAANYQTYTGSAVVHIEPKPVASCSVQDIPARTYNGKAHTPEPVVTDGEKTLRRGIDYTVSHTNNIAVGTAQIVLTGRGNYTGTKSVGFPIAAESMDGKTEKMVLEQKDYVYTGEEIHPKVQIWDAEGTLLTESKDYTLRYSHAVNAGMAEVQAVFQGNYKGSISKSFEIQPLEVTDAALTEEEYLYNGKEHCPQIADYKEGVDYHISFQNNINAGNAAAVIVFRGNYKGTVTKEFVIHQRKVTVVPDFPESQEVNYHDGLTLSESALSIKENEAGRFEWVNPEEPAVVKNNGYPVRFVPYDTANFDWTEVNDWDAEQQAVVRTVALVVRKAKGKLADIGTRALAEGDCLGDSEISWDRNDGKLSWSDPEQRVTPEISQYSMDFIPNDTSNYDWSEAGEWQEEKGIYRIMGNVTVIANPAAGSVYEGDMLSSSNLSSNQEGAVYEWESPEHIVQKDDTKEGGYRVIYRYQGNVLVRKVPVVIREKPVETERPVETKKPMQTECPSVTEQPGESLVPLQTEEPLGTGQPPEAETKDTTEPVPDIPVPTAAPEPPVETETEWGPNAYEMINQLMTTKVFSAESRDLKKEINAVKMQKIHSTKVKVKWITKRKMTVRMKKGKKLKFRIKGVPKKQKVYWHSSSKKRMTVTKNGVVRAKKTGKVKLTARVGKKNYICRIRIRK